MSASVRTAIPLPIDLADRTPEIVTFDGLADPREHVAIVFRPLPAVPLVRIHSECLTGDLLGSLRCDCGLQYREAITQLDRHGGVLLYMRQEGRGIGLYNKLDAYRLQDEGLDTFAANLRLGRGADERSYDDCAALLTALGVRSCRLLTNNPDKVAGLERSGIQVAGAVPTGYFRQRTNAAYLDAKETAGHRFQRAAS
ncbi:MAG TPA: GTP cyclohydrolase II [Jatrophihabitans sp.]|nr:GTP cyclohydrolase II [Jatrophihabitans sp.]